MTTLEWVGSGLMLIGGVLALLAAWGIIDFPTPMSRMHATTKPASLGLSALTLGAGVAAGSWALVGVGILVTAFLFLTAPIAGHMLGRAAYLAGQTNLIYDELTGAETKAPPESHSTSRQTTVVRLVGIVTVWILLWGDVSGGVVVGGLIVAAVVEAARTGFGDAGMPHSRSILPFTLTYIWLLLESNARVAWEVITPSNELIQEAIVAVPLRTRSVPVAMLVANAVSFSPGTLTVELAGDPMVLYVHVLQFTTKDAVQAEVWKLESLIDRSVTEQV